MDFNSETMKGAHVSFALAARLVQQEPDEAWVRTCIAGPVRRRPVRHGRPCGGRRPGTAVGLVRRRAGRPWRRARQPFGANGCACSSASARPRRRYGKRSTPSRKPRWLGRSTLAVRAAYRAWGLEFERKAHEPEDALGLMLAFCSFLMEREIEALEEGDEAAAAKAASSLEAFMAEHMLPWASAWRFLVQNHAKTDYYRGVGELVFGLERAYARRFGITCDPEDGTFSYAAGA